MLKEIKSRLIQEKKYLHSLRNEEYYNMMVENNMPETINKLVKMVSILTKKHYKDNLPIPYIKIQEILNEMGKYAYDWGGGIGLFAFQHSMELYAFIDRMEQEAKEYAFFSEYWEAINADGR